MSKLGLIPIVNEPSLRLKPQNRDKIFKLLKNIILIKNFLYEKMTRAEMTRRRLPIRKFQHNLNDSDFVTTDLNVKTICPSRKQDVQTKSRLLQVTFLTYF